MMVDVFYHGKEEAADFILDPSLFGRGYSAYIHQKIG
jgi:hypothetical protein